MRRFLPLLPLLVAAGCAGSSPEAQTQTSPPAPLEVPDCDALAGPERERADRLFAESYIHDCCDQPLAACLRAQPRCALASRLAANVCRRVGAGATDEVIERALTLRARMMQSTQIETAAAIDFAGSPVAGNEAAPVTIVLYAGPRGTHCARMTPLIHAAVSSGGPLAGKAKLYLKPFPLRSNPHSKEAGMGFLAAQQLGKLWELVLYSYARFDQFSVEQQSTWAEAVGLDRAEFERLAVAPETKQQLSASKLEGLENGVDSTPTFFIDGHHYQGELVIDELVDTALEIHDRSQGLIHER